MRLKYLLFLISYILLTAYANPVSAVSPNVPPESDFYDKLEKLQSFGLIDNFVSGIKPLSREEFARQIKEAVKNRGADPGFDKKLADEIIDYLKKEFKEELREEKKEAVVRMWDESSTGIVELNDYPTAHLETDALNRPLVANRAGENLEKGFNSVTDLKGWIEFPKFASIYLEPKMIFRQRENHFNLDIPRGNLKLGHNNFELELGRDVQMWGFGHSGQMQLSDNIRGLTMVKLSNPYPTYLPWIFKHLGQMKFSYLFSVLENQRDHAYPTFWAMALMFKPSRYFEWGIGRTTMLGGKGLSGGNFWDYFFEGVIGIRAFDTTKTNVGNSSYAAYFLFNFPFLRNSQIYFDGYFEDWGIKDLKTGIAFTRDLAFLTGINIPRLNGSGTLGLRTEFVKTTQITYRHGFYTDGYTYLQNIMGHQIGPNALGTYTKFSLMPNTKFQISLDFNYERHGRLGIDQYSNPLPPDIFEKPEDRYILIFSAEKALSEKLRIKASIGYDRIVNYSFKSGINKNETVAEMELKYRF